MKRIYSLLVALIIAQLSFAQWPENYGGVMLQGFYWNSFEDSKWTNLTAQSDELSKYFDLIWVPNAGNCRSGNSMGYLPVYWFQNYNSSFGTKAELLDMIKTYKDKGVGIMEDVVLNHKSPIGRNDSWIDFINETFKLNGETMSVTWSGADICQNDDGGDTRAKGWEVTGNNDSGEDFAGARDLDHTSANVQRNCKLYCQFLLNELGFAGFRYDMVKGYSPEYVKMYNEASSPQFSVGEFFDYNTDAVKWWIEGTNWTSAAFDFPLKNQLNQAFGNENWDALNYKGLSADPSLNRYSVSFVDNHDTSRDNNKLASNILAANAFILAMPGTPCIYLPHWQAYKVSIGNMILARKAAGITNQSPIVEQGAQGGGYVIKVQGTNGTVLCINGYVQNYNTTGFKLIATGQNFAYFVTENVTVTGLNTTDEDPGEALVGDPHTVYVTAPEAPHLYAWNSEGTPLNGKWPGKKMTETATVNGQEFYKATIISEGSYNIIFNDGNGNQTADISGLTGDCFFTYNGSTGYAPFGEEILTETTVYVEAETAPYLYAWESNGNELNGAWPGTQMTETEIVNGKTYYKKHFDVAPINVIFNDGDVNQTENITNIMGNCYFTYNGQSEYTTLGVKSITWLPTEFRAPQFNLQGQRVNGSYRGIVIQNGKKYMIK